MNILFVSQWLPYPPDNGSRIRVFNLLKQLSKYHQVHLISFAEDKASPSQLEALGQYCEQVDLVPVRQYDSRHRKAMLGFFALTPRSLVDTYSLEMEQRVQQACRQTKFDVLIASQLGTAEYVQHVPSNAIKIFEEVELTPLYENWKRQTNRVKRARNQLTWWKLVHYMTNLLKSFESCTVVSDKEREQFHTLIPSHPPIEVIPNGVDVNYYTGDFGQPETDTLIYSGALTYQANFDAVDYFLHEIFPLIQQQRPQVKLYITGKLTGVPVEKLPYSDNVHFLGYVDDIRPTVAQKWVNIVPLRIGGGTRLKILESLALGTPVVTTSKGVEGIDCTPGTDLIVADTPAAFAESVLRLLADHQQWAKLSDNGRRVVAKYDWDIIGQRFNQVVETVTHHPSRLPSEGVPSLPSRLK